MHALTKTLLDETIIAGVQNELSVETCSYLLSLFVTELEELSQKLLIAIAEKEHDGINDIMHVLKNSAAVYGASLLYESAKNLYDDEQVNPEQIFQAATHVHTLCEQTFLAYSKFIENQNINIQGISDVKK